MSGAVAVPRDDREAVYLYKLAADQGVACGQNALGVFYANGRGGLPKDDREAVRLFKLAADQGFAMGQVNLGDCYMKGFGGLSKDDREAARTSTSPGTEPGSARTKCDSSRWTGTP